MITGKLNVVTINLNPAVDMTIMVNNFQPGIVNRAETMVINAGGKGVNVASVLAEYGISVGVTGFLGRDNAQIHEKHFSSKGIEDHFVRIPGETRINVKVNDRSTHLTTDINLPGLRPTPDDFGFLLSKLDILAHDADWFILTGGLPPGLSPEVYGQLINLLKGKGRSVVLDTSGEALRKGLQAKPDWVKPNLEELRVLLDKPPSGTVEVTDLAKTLVKSGIGHVVVSMGPDGALFVSEKEIFRMVPPKVSAVSTVGAGDSLVAGLVAGAIKGLSFTDQARLAIAFSVAAVTRETPSQPIASNAINWINQIAVIPVA